MTISSALSAALTGLSANSRAASVVSDNIANARTEGFGTRGLSLSSISHGGGVRIDGVTRASDPVLLGERRAAGAGQGEAETRATFLQRIEGLIGPPTARQAFRPSSTLSRRVSSRRKAAPTASRG